MVTSNSNNGTTTYVSQAHQPAEPTTTRVVDPNEREIVEIPLPSNANMNLEVDEEVIEEFANEAYGVSKPHLT